jgi:hypothetical protein
MKLRHDCATLRPPNSRDPYGGRKLRRHPDERFMSDDIARVVARDRYPSSESAQGRETATFIRTRPPILLDFLAMSADHALVGR